MMQYLMPRDTTSLDLLHDIVVRCFDISGIFTVIYLPCIIVSLSISLIIADVIDWLLACPLGPCHKIPTQV